uniref:Uncharacterized protein n=1 Tax=Anguilla anguilla TaxID=7936 RepID=A0A0E9PSY7_ANGAN
MFFYLPSHCIPWLFDGNNYLNGFHDIKTNLKCVNKQTNKQCSFPSFL